MREQYDMSLAYDSYLAPAVGPAVAEPARAPEPRLTITVVFTSVEATLGALKEAGRLADRLGGQITLLVAQVVPYPLPLTSPPVLIDWNERRFRVLAGESPVETRVLLFLCRDRVETLIATLGPHSVIVVGGRKRWWPTSDTLLARALRRAGHEVIFKEWSRTDA